MLGQLGERALKRGRDWNTCLPRTRTAYLDWHRDFCFCRVPLFRLSRQKGGASCVRRQGVPERSTQHGRYTRSTYHACSCELISTLSCWIGFRLPRVDLFPSRTRPLQALNEVRSNPTCCAVRVVSLCAGSRAEILKVCVCCFRLFIQVIMAVNINISVPALVSLAAEIVEIELDVLRNNILRFELLLSISAFMVTLGALVTGKHLFSVHMW